MNIPKNKSGKLSSKTLLTVVFIAVSIIILIEVFATTVPLVDNAGDKMNVSNSCTREGCIYNSTSAICFAESNESKGGCEATAYQPAPLNNLFGSGSVTTLAIVAALVILVIGIALFMFKTKK